MLSIQLDHLSAEQIEVSTFIILFLLLNLLFLFGSTSIAATACGSSSTTAAATATTATTHRHQFFDGSTTNHLGEEHGPVWLYSASSCLDQVIHGCRVDFSTIVMKDEGGISAKQLILLLLRELRRWNTCHEALCMRVC